jgi:signal transduction histidine kinase
LEQFNDLNPDLLLVDLHMPNLNGFQLIEKLRSIVPEETFLPVIVMTGDTSPANKRSALISGAADLMAKPIDSSELLMRIRILLRTRFLQRELQNQNHLLESKVNERTHELGNALADLKATQVHMLQQERLRAFAEMAGGVVHDFNNALMAVIGYSDLLMQEPAILNGDETLREYLDIINTAGRDASNVVGRLRDFYRPREEGDVFESVDLNKVIEQAVQSTQPKWKGQSLERGLSINVEMDLEKLPAMKGISADLRELMTNLIFNAVDAMPMGGTITLKTCPLPGQIGFSISDTGTGMTEEVRARCLEPFFSTKGELGTGLGLSMVFGVIARHEGRIEIESEQGCGTTFRIFFPPEGESDVQASVEALPLVRPLQVLVVDDEEQSREIVSKYLTSDGHKVLSVSGPEKAIAHFQDNGFDLIITDQGMPGMTGTNLGAVFKQMREDQPVILMTGFAEPSAPIEGHVDMVLRKPISQGELRRALTDIKLSMTPQSCALAATLIPAMSKYR